MFAFRNPFRGAERRSSASFGSLQNPLTAMLLGAFRQTASGIAVNPTTALRCSTVYACIKVIAETVAELPLKLYRKRDDGGRDPAEDHPLYWLLTDAPNDWTPVSEFKLAMTARWCLEGNAFSFCNRNPRGQI